MQIRKSATWPRWLSTRETWRRDVNCTSCSRIDLRDTKSCGPLSVPRLLYRRRVLSSTFTTRHGYATNSRLSAATLYLLTLLAIKASRTLNTHRTVKSPAFTERNTTTYRESPNVSVIRANCARPAVDPRLLDEREIALRCPTHTHVYEYTNTYHVIRL